MRIFLSLLTFLILGTSALSLALEAYPTINKIKSKFPNQQKSLFQLQQEFLDLWFGMFIHCNIPTFGGHDWPDTKATSMHAPFWISKDRKNQTES